MSEARSADQSTVVRPILKWAGGKRQLLPALRPYYPAAFSRYVEPFVGSGAVFLDLHNRGLLVDREVCLSDINADTRR
jgi:DNA adenine methylase